ncbi:hypothetical protein AB832_03170 [Flavobacteriaceae bacterium (ex Bugula neritina AB1)]|nr:hypothetical protein AB832_03170 [Flavobacteriaceae bacterium (ex Bugula neritina AB1)]
MEGLTNTNEALYNKSNKAEYIQNTQKGYERADILINNIRQTLNNYKYKVIFAKKTKEIYKRAIEFQLLLYKQTKNSKALELAFYYTEKSKANTLRELLNDANAKNFTGISSNLMSLEKKLKVDLSLYRSKILKEKSRINTDISLIEEFENKLFSINRSQDSLIEVLETKYPDYYQLKHQNNVITVADIRNNLDDKTTLLEFFTSDNTTYAFTISKNGIKVREVITPKLAADIEELRKLIINKSTISFKKTSQKLYKELIKPIRNQIVGDHLIIIPDGSLWHLNFELLLTQDNTSNNPKDFKYLLNDLAISYANSATLLFTSFKKSSGKKGDCLAFSFSDSTYTQNASAVDFATIRSTIDDLPGTRKEIKDIADIVDGQYFYGSEAIESNFKKNAGRYKILHLALHGEVDNERPENSKLYFTKEKDTLEDNLLYSHELLTLDIPTELTVLSACNTGTGKIAKGEGIMSLGTAFQYAGTKSLLLSSWEVSDNTTPQLMKYFYMNLKQGMSKPKSLQQAKISYLNNAKVNRIHPFYWGGFYLVGDPSPVQFNSIYWQYWTLGLITLGILIVSIFWYRRKRVM